MPKFTEHISARAIVQVFLTLLTLSSGIATFVFSILFRQLLKDSLQANFIGPLKDGSGGALPCIRSTLDICDNSIEDVCWDRCCPIGYICKISPIEGLYCQDSSDQCVTVVEGTKTDVNKFNWCRDLADVTTQCKSSICERHTMIKDAVVPCVIICLIAVILDVVDLVTFCVAPDAVRWKSSVNVVCSCFKWIAFGTLIGTGTQKFLLELHANQCYNNNGQEVVEETILYFMTFCVACATSAVASLAEAPFSAYYGGKLVGVPYVK